MPKLQTYDPMVVERVRNEAQTFVKQKGFVPVICLTNYEYQNVMLYLRDGNKIQINNDGIPTNLKFKKM